MPASSRVIKNTGWLYARMAVSMFISLYTTRLVLGGLGAADFGIYHIVGGAIAMLGFLNSAMAAATQRFMSYYEGEGDWETQRSIFNISIVLHMVLSAVVVLVLFVAGFAFFGGILNIPASRVGVAEVVYACLVASVALTVVNVPYDAVMNAHENMRYYALVGILESFLKLAVAVACLYTSRDKLVVYGVLMAVIPLVTLTIMKVYCHRHYAECVVSPRRYFDRRMLNDMVSFAGWNFLGSASSLVGNYGLGIIANHFFGVIVNAAMGITTQLNGQLMVLTTNMMKAVNPIITKKAGAGHPSEMLDWSYSACRFSYLLLAWAAIPMCFEAKYALHLWLGRVPEWTVVFIRLQLVRSLIEQLTLPLGVALSATGKIRETNVQCVVLYSAELVGLCLLLAAGCPPYTIYLVMVVLVSVRGWLTLRLCGRYASMSCVAFVREVAVPTSLLNVAMCAGAWLPSVFMEESVFRLLVVLLFSWAFMGVVCVSGFFRKREKDILLGVCWKVLSRARINTWGR